MVVKSDTILQLAYGFILPLCSNFVSKIHRFRHCFFAVGNKYDDDDDVTYWSKIADKPILGYSHLARFLGLTPCEFFSTSHSLPESRIMWLSDSVHFTILLSL